MHTTWNRGETPLKDGQPMDFNTLSINYYTDCIKKDINYYYGTSVVSFGTFDPNCGGENCDWYGHWMNASSGTWKTEYTPKQRQDYPYVYDKNNEYKIEIEEAKLMSYEQATFLVCDDNSSSCLKTPSWVWSTTYWTGSASGNSMLWSAFSDGDFSNTYYYDEFGIGVRPVIVIIKDLFN